jgi:tetratricopeptide (TPR) repeat protein
MPARSRIHKGLFLLLLAGPFCATDLPAQAPPPPGARRILPTVPGKNSVTGLVVKQSRFGQWTADFDYFYTGEPYFTQVSIELTPQSGSPVGPGGPQQYISTMPGVQLGAHHINVEIHYPGSAQRTTRIAVLLRGGGANNNDAVASQQLDQVIDWPDPWTWHRNTQLATASPEESLKQAVGLIDTEDSRQQIEARAILEALVRDNPRFDAGYVELARVAMKTNWGPGGLHQAEGLLNSALQVNPGSVNAKILLGYVYAHEEHYEKAEALFVEASHAKTNNLWLWSNWGELLTLEGKKDEAIAKYRQGLAHPMTHDTNDHARNAASENLLKLLSERTDLDGMEALYKQRIEEFGPGACYSDEYSKFLLQIRGDTQATIDLATRALNQNCNDAGSRDILGLALYVKWSATPGQPGTDALNQARMFLPAGPKPLYLLATSDRTLAAASKLIDSGEDIDQKDNEGMTALALALQDHDTPAARRLLKLGAHPEIPVGGAQIPVALLPVLDADVGAIRMLRQNGVNYSKLRFRGTSAFDIAAESGNHALIEALGSREAQL